ncbi:N-acetylneuraminate synthase family protein [bacterium]|nr:N-acetylneuraminate synthase family protein [bacterium]
MLAKEIINISGGLPQAPYIIAEAGVNHEGSMSLARRLIEEAAEAGADAIKFQTYRADSIAVRKSPAYWDLEEEPTTSQHELFSKYDKFWKSEFEQLKSHCDKTGIEFLSTPFDIESAIFLNDLMGAFKISSSDITNKPFIQFMASFGKPFLLSTGASNKNEIEAALGWIDEKKTPTALLHCVLNYPTLDHHANLAMIIDLKKAFPDRVIGYSDHTLPGNMDNLHFAWLMGAQILEKHFTHDKSLVGNDHYHAMDKQDLAIFREKQSRSQSILGDKTKRALDSESSARKNARRSLVTTMSIRSGTTLSAEMLTWKRPASGISPSEIDSVLGRQVTCDLEPDDVLMVSHLGEKIK